jgi:hypothetical protein
MGHISQRVVIIKDLTHLTNMTFFMTVLFVKNGAEKYLQANLTVLAPIYRGLQR